MKTFLLAFSLIVMLALAIAGAIYVWIDMGDIEMSTPGLLAMLAGIVLSIGLGVGLMFLVFKSARDGGERG